MKDEKIEVRRTNTPDKYFTIVESAIWRISHKVMVGKNGKKKEIEFTSDARGLYTHLLTYLNREKYHNTGESNVFPTYEKMTEIFGWGKRRLSNAIKILKETGLIEVKKKDGSNGHVYEPVDLKFSNILYDRVDENGEYVHKEIDWYIKAVKEERDKYQKREVFTKEIDPFMLTILQKFGISEEDLSPKEHKALKEILDSGLYEEPDILKEAIKLAKEGKGIADFIYHFSGIDTNKERQKSPGKLISLSDGAEIFGLEKEKDRD